MTNDSRSNTGPNTKSSTATSSPGAAPSASSETIEREDATKFIPATSKPDAGVQPGPTSSNLATSTHDASVKPPADAAATTARSASGTVPSDDGGASGLLKPDAETPSSRGTVPGDDGGASAPLESDAETPSFGGVVVEDRSNRLAGTVPSLDVNFSAKLQPDGTTVASYTTLESVIEVVLQPRDSQIGSILINGLEISGRGDIDDDQKAALQQIVYSPLGVAVIQVPLELGCQISYSELADERAALLLPWQLLLKYQPTFANVYQAEAQSGCKYFSLPSAGPTGLLLDQEWAFPRIFGYYPVEFEEPSMTPTDGSLYIVDNSFTDSSGNCRSRCRGACGADCAPRNCVSQGLTFESSCETIGDIATAVTEAVETLACGVEKGCVDHDACYDTCVERYGCALVSFMGPNFYCHLDCDNGCIGAHSLSECTAWAVGLSSSGTFSSFETFRDAKPDTREAIPCDGDCANGACLPLCDSTTCPSGCCDDNGECNPLAGTWTGTAKQATCQALCSGSKDREYTAQMTFGCASSSQSTGSFYLDGSLFGVMTSVSVMGTSIALQYNFSGSGSHGSCTGALSDDHLTTTCTDVLGPEYGEYAGQVNGTTTEDLYRN